MPQGKGEDTLAAMGDDAYFAEADKALGLNTVQRARDVLRSTQDPEARFVAAYEQMQREATESTPKQPVRASRLAGGDGFMIHGQPVTVLESEDGYLTLHGSGFDGIELDGLSTIPIDEGSLARGIARGSPDHAGGGPGKAASDRRLRAVLAG